jgi:hypothetical protein
MANMNLTGVVITVGYILNLLLVADVVVWWVALLMAPLPVVFWYFSPLPNATQFRTSNEGGESE